MAAQTQPSLLNPQAPAPNPWQVTLPQPPPSLPLGMSGYPPTMPMVGSSSPIPVPGATTPLLPLSDWHNRFHNWWKDVKGIGWYWATFALIVIAMILVWTAFGIYLKRHGFTKDDPVTWTLAADGSLLIVCLIFVAYLTFRHKSWHAAGTSLKASSPVSSSDETLAMCQKRCGPPIM